MCTWLRSRIPLLTGHHATITGHHTGHKCGRGQESSWKAHWPNKEWFSCRDKSLLCRRPSGGEIVIEHGVEIIMLLPKDTGRCHSLWPGHNYRRPSHVV